MTESSELDPLPPGQQLVAAGKWPLIGGRAPAQRSDPWRVSIAGCLRRPISWSLDELASQAQVETKVDLHCVTRWSKLGVPFRGVLLKQLLKLAAPTASARFVSFVARTDPPHSTSLPLADAIELGTIVALRAEDQPLPPEHGGPVRVIVPGRYFYKSLKWLERIDLLETDRLGTWEATAGYHNRADPWRQERYLAPQLSRQEMRALLNLRDWSAQDLRGIRAADHDLPGLRAHGALLRDADFRRCDLRGASFQDANLSNARFQGADLQQASFKNADVEGANFAGADLRGADLRVISLVGASFRTEPHEAAVEPIAARFDQHTQFTPATLEQLTPHQAAFVHKASVLRET